MTARMEPATPKVRQFVRSDMGNGERLAHLHGKDIHWVQAWRTWLIWDGRVWKRDKTIEIERRAKGTVRAIYAEAQKADDDARPLLAKWAVASEGAARVRSMIDMAKSEPGVAVSAESFDQSQWLFNADNGTIDLRTGEMRAFGRADLLTKMSAVPYDESASCPLWESFLLQIFGNDTALVDYLQRAIGYSLTGVTDEQVLHLMHGSGSNGKSTFLEVLSLLLGEYGLQADFTAFLDDKQAGPREDIARMAGARVVCSNEIGEGKKFNESLIKSLTGGDTIAARFLYGDTFEFRPQFKLWLAANHKPVIRGTDFAIWRRVRLIPFDITIPDAEQDHQLLDKLRGELPGILRWAVAGCLMWIERGLTAPPVVLAATGDYREESDLLGAFLEDCCELAPEFKARSDDLYAVYLGWAKDNGEYGISQTVLGRRLKERHLLVEKRGGVKYRNGLRLRAGVEVPSKRRDLFSKNGNQDS